MNPFLYYGVSVVLLGIAAFGAFCVLYGLWHVPRELRAIPPENRKKVLVGTILMAVFYALLVWGIVTGMWASVARGQEVPPSDPIRREELLTLERRIADLEAALQRTANTFNPILHHGTMVEIWLDPVTGPAMHLTQDALGKIHVFIQGELHVSSSAELEGDLTVKGNVSFDPRRLGVKTTIPQTSP